VVDLLLNLSVFIYIGVTIVSINVRIYK
jgi:hypothetical protein